MLLYFFWFVIFPSLSNEESVLNKVDGHVAIAAQRLGTFDLNDKFNSFFDISISSIPQIEDDFTEIRPDQHMIVLSKFGQKYACELPLGSQEEAAERESPPLHSVSELLQPLTNSCFQKTIGWWTYEYCHGNHIRQYHLEGAKIVGNTYTIGYYQNESDWSDYKWEEGNHRDGQVHKVEFVNGTECDLTGEQRRATVKIHCSLNGNGLEGIAEPESCNYVFTVGSTQLCLHPLFRTKRAEKKEKIICHPLITRDVLEQRRTRASLEKVKHTKISEKDLEDKYDWHTAQHSASNMLESLLFALADWDIADEEVDQSDAEEENYQSDSEEGNYQSDSEEGNYQSDLEEGNYQSDSEESDFSVNSNIRNIERQNTAGDDFIDGTTDREHQPNEAEKLVEEGEQLVEEGEPVAEGEGQKSSSLSVSERDLEKSEGDVERSEDDVERSEDAQFLNLGGWRVKISQLKAKKEQNEVEGEELKELQDQISKELEEELAKMGVEAGGKVKVKIITTQDFENNEESTNELFRSLPDDNTKVLSNYLKDILSGGRISATEQMKQSELEEGYSKVWEEDRTEDLDDRATRFDGQDHLDDRATRFDGQDHLDDRVTHFDHNAEYMESSEADSDQDTEEEDKHSDHDIL